MFYDVTTLYFETDKSDELQESGFSKDGKHSQPQVVLGLLVSKDGYPLLYSLFNGSQYEGRTMLPIVEDFIQRSKLIEAHACICFVAYKIYKELERILKTNNIKLSVDKVLDIAKTMIMTTKHKSIAKLFDNDLWK